MNPADPELNLDSRTVLRAAHISKAFGRHKVLADVSLDLGRGQLAGIAGENGSGKSTLLKILVGIIAPAAGEVAVHGRIGYCPQETAVFGALTVRENFQYFAAAYGLPSYEDTMNDLLRRFGFQQYADRQVSELSGGTRQKLNLTLSLLHLPDVLILDEPYAGFDWETYQRFWEYTEEMRSAGKSALIVSHFVSDRARFDQLFDLKNGVLECA